MLYCFYAVIIILAYHINILLLNPFRPEVHVSNIIDLNPTMPYCVCITKIS